MSLARRIEKRLRAVGLKRAAASKKAGLNESYVRDLIDAETPNPRAEHLARLAVVLKTTPEWLLHERGEEEPSAEQLE